MSESRMPIEDMKVDGANLYREEMVTDLKVATIRRLVPITVDGEPDPSRTPVFTGETQVLTQAGPLPVSSKLEANNLKEAIDAFPQAIKEAMQRMMDEVRELQRKEASRIVVPGRDTKGKIELP